MAQVINPMWTVKATHLAEATVHRMNEEELREAFLGIFGIDLPQNADVGNIRYVLSKAAEVGALCSNVERIAYSVASRLARW